MKTKPPSDNASCIPSTLQRLGDAFHRAYAAEALKTPMDRVKEQAAIPFHMLRGAARGVMGLLESGSIVNSLLQDSEALTDPRTHLSQKQKNFQEAKDLCQEAVRNPSGFLGGMAAGMEKEIADRAIRFLEGDVKTRGEMAGELAPGLAFFILSGKFPGKINLAPKLPKGLSLRKIPLGVKNAREFRSYSNLILKTTQDILKKSLDKKAFTGVRGSSVTGLKHSGGVFGPNSDLDFFVVSDELFLEGRKRGARGRKGMLYVGDTMRYFQKELVPVEKKITAGLQKHPEIGPGRKATIRIFSQKGFDQIAQGAGKEIVSQPSAGFWLKYQVKNWLDQLAAMVK